MKDVLETKYHVIVPFAALMLVALACTCGPLSQLQEVQQELESAAPTFEALATEAALLETQSASDGGDFGQLDALPPVEDGGATDGGAGDGGTTGAASDYCSAVYGDIEALFGPVDSLVTRTEEGDLANTMTCVYGTADGKLYSVTITNSSSTEGAGLAYEGTVQGLGFVYETVDDVSGSGSWDTASIARGGDGLNSTLVFRKGVYIGTVVVSGVSDDDTIGITSTLAGALP